jgi:predicted transcriptional regulator
MKKELLDVLFKSEKRKNVLLLLQDGAKGTEDILSALDTTRQALLPQMKILEEHYLVDHYDDTYELTTIGKLLVDEMTPLLNKIEVLDNDIDYWGTHNLDFIPPHLLKRIKEIKYCEVIEPSLVNIYEVNKDFVVKAKDSSALFFIFTFMHPVFTQILSQFVENDINVSIIVNEEMLEKLKQDWNEEVKEFIASGKVKFYLYRKKVGFLSLSLSDHSFILRLLSKKNEFSNKQLSCCNSTSYQWSKDLFEYHLKDSTLINEL